MTGPLGLQLKVNHLDHVIQSQYLLMVTPATHFHTVAYNPLMGADSTTQSDVAHAYPKATIPDPALDGFLLGPLCS